MMTNVELMSANDLIREIKQKALGVEELTKAFLERIERYDGKKGLNSIVELNPKVLQQAKELDNNRDNRNGILYGMPILVKDNFDVKGLHTRAGSLALKDHIAAQDAKVIANLKRQGALILGKTNMTEFANYTSDHMPGGYSSFGGQVINAYDSKLSPSGSSSGSAVAMSAGLCAAAIGTDTCFSVVGCVREQGVCGLKPPHGALSLQGIVPISHTLDSPGPITRTLSDALLVYSGMRDTLLPDIQAIPVHQLKAAVNQWNKDLVSDQLLAKFDHIAEKLRNDGAFVQTIEQKHTKSVSVVMRCEFKHDLEAYLHGTDAQCQTLQEILAYYESHPETCLVYGDSYLKNAYEHASGTFQDIEYIEAMKERDELKIQIKAQLQEYDVCIMTGPTNVMHLTGIPSLCLPLCMGEEGFPYGIIMYGVDEMRLWSAAKTIERYCEPVRMPDLK